MKKFTPTIRVPRSLTGLGRRGMRFSLFMKILPRIRHLVKFMSLPTLWWVSQWAALSDGPLAIFVYS